MSTAEVTDIALRRDEGTLSLASAALTIQDLVAQKQLIAMAMKDLMKPNEHYGVIPGTGKRKDADGNDLPPKPSLLKPGADTIGFMFRLDADYVTEECVREPGYIYYRIKCILTHIPTGKRVGCGMGSCNSREEKYVRAAAKKCPACGKESIIKGKDEYERDPAFKGGWLCYQRKGGCGAKYKPGDPAIEKQSNGVADPSDLDNTILKMALKRARIDAVLTATAASDFFTQDVENLTELATEYTPPKEQTPPSQPRTAGASTVAPPTSGTAPATARTGQKKVTAADIPHEGVQRTKAQNDRIHALREQCGGVYSGAGDEQRAQWLKVIGVYRDAKGERIASSADLSKNQASHLIQRMEGYLAKVTARAAEVPDLDAIGGHPPDELAKLRAEIDGKQKDGDESLEVDLLEIFRVQRISDLPTQLADKALALTLAWGTNAYVPLRSRIMDQLA